jgi:urease accessory protein
MQPHGEEMVSAAGHESERRRIFDANRGVSRIALSMTARGGVTRRKRVHESGSLRVRFPNSSAREPEAVIVNTGGGIAGGDRADLDVSLEPGARLVITTAAAEKVYRALDTAASIAVKAEVGAGASLAWLPQETILFDRVRLERTIDIGLADDAALLFGESIVFGRAAMGEVVAQGALIDRWRVRRGGRLVFAEGLRLDGAVSEKLARRAAADGGAALATVLIAPGGEAELAAVRALNENFAGDVGISAWNGIAVARLCAKDGAVLRRDLTHVLAALRPGGLPRLWLN